MPRLQAAIALTYAALCMAGQPRHIRAATKRLADELERQILPDGGHISRNPGALIELLVDLLPLRQVFTARNMPPPPALLNAIDRMMPMLRFFRHGDGNFALFNGMGPTPTDLLTTILAYDDARGTPVANAPHSGYQRLEAGGTLLLMDTGARAAARRQPGGACRLPVVRAVVAAEPHRGQLRPAGDQPRQLAAGRARDRRPFDRHLQRHVVVPLHRVRPGQAHAAGHADRRRAAATSRSRARSSDGAIVLRASHDGYADELRRHPPARADAVGRRAAARRRGPVHAGARRDRSPAGRDQFAVRFHLHPAVKANRLTDGHGAMLLLPNKEVWTFNAYEDRVDIEESVYLAGTDGPRRTVQIVIYGRARKVTRVQWTFAPIAERPRPPRGVRRARGAATAAVTVTVPSPLRTRRYPAGALATDALPRRPHADYWSHDRPPPRSPAPCSPSPTRPA